MLVTPLIEIVFSFDTTGSMYPCLAEVRRKISQTVRRLFGEIPNLRIGIIAHGDYCDERSTYVTKYLALTSDVKAICDFVENVRATGGGDFEECYELVLHEAHTLVKWTEGSKRVLGLIGDAIPQSGAENPKRLNWRDELKKLTNIGVVVHGIQCLNHGKRSDDFFKEIAHNTGGFHLRLTQFNEATEMLLAVVYQQQGPEALEKYEAEVISEKRMTRSMTGIFDTLSRRDAKGRFRKIDVRAVDAGRFQQIRVERDQPIKQLVEENSLVFQVGRGFYEFTKRETIQAKKQVVVEDIETGDFYEGDAAREVLSLPTGKPVDISPKYDRSKYKVYVQSTSYNRKLLGDTNFLYDSSL